MLGYKAFVIYYYPKHKTLVVCGRSPSSKKASRHVNRSAVGIAVQPAAQGVKRKVPCTGYCVTCEGNVFSKRVSRSGREDSFRRLTKHGLRYFPVVNGTRNTQKEPVLYCGRLDPHAKHLYGARMQTLHSLFLVASESFFFCGLPTAAPSRRCVGARCVSWFLNDGCHWSVLAI